MINTVSPLRYILPETFIDVYNHIYFQFIRNYAYICFLGGSEVKISPATAGDKGLIPGLGKSPGEGDGNRL